MSGFGKLKQNANDFKQIEEDCREDRFLLNEEEVEKESQTVIKEMERAGNCAKFTVKLPPLEDLTIIHEQIEIDVRTSSLIHACK